MATVGPPPNVLSAGSIAKCMAGSLPRDVSPQLKTPYDAVALACHASMMAVGFRLVGLGEEHRLEKSSDAAEPSQLPADWNASSNYAFRYRHTQSSMEYLLKINRMGNKAVVMAMAMGDDRTTTFDLRVVDFVSQSSLPSTPVSSDKSIDEATRTLTNIFISEGRLTDLGGLMRLKVIQKLIPSLQKEGYEERAEGGRAADHAPSRAQRDPLREDYQPPARPQPYQDPLAQPRRPFPSGDFPPPDFEDPYDMTRPLQPLGRPGGYGNLGERDLYPQGLGPNDPFRAGPGGFGGGGGGGGMHPSFDDPLFSGQGGAGRAFDPRAPPGSRYDPVGPGGAPRGSGGQGFPGQGMGGRPPNPFGGFGSGDFI